jgi:hypothetical protein
LQINVTVTEFPRNARRKCSFGGKVTHTKKCRAALALVRVSMLLLRRGEASRIFL